MGLNLTEELNILLPFNIEGQKATIGWLLKNKDFSYKCKTHLKAEMFANDMLGDIYSAITDFMVKYNDVPGVDNLCSIFIVKEKTEYLNYRKVIYDCIAQSNVFNFDFIQNRISDWLKITIFRDAQIKAQRYYKQADIPTLKGILQNCINDIDDVKFNKPVEYDLSDPVKDIQQSLVNKESCITTGLPELDGLMGKGLFKGEHTVAVGGLNSGKSTFVMNVIYHNLIRQKHCLWVVHEGVPLTLMNKLRQRFLKWTEEELLMAVNKEEEIAKLRKINDDIKKYLVFIPMIKSGGLYVEDVTSEVKRQMEKLHAKEGKYFDLFVNDYPKKLGIRMSRQMGEKRDRLAYVYEEMHRIAMQYECHSISPAQINREGYKQNRNREPGEYLGSENISEAFEIGQDCDNLITINRSDRDIHNNIIYIAVDKTRNHENKQSIMINTDFARGITHDPSLGCLLMNQNALSIMSPNNLIKPKSD